MRNNLTELLDGLKKSGPDMWDYLESIESDNFGYTDDILKALSIAKKNRERWEIDYLLMIAQRDGVDKRYVPILVELLPEDWHDKQEDIMMLLKTIKDPTTVDPIFARANIIPDYDDGRSLAKKSIWALGAINTANAIDKLHLLSESNDKIISSAAQMQLEALKR